MKFKDEKYYFFSIFVLSLLSHSELMFLCVVACHNILWHYVYWLQNGLFGSLNFQKETQFTVYYCRMYYLHWDTTQVLHISFVRGTKREMSRE